MPAIAAGHVTAFFLFDAAEVIDLAAAGSLVGGASRVRLTQKTTTPSYVQYEQAPLTIDGGAIGLPEALGFTVRFKLFDYGVISVALTRPIPGTWPELVDCGITLQDDARLGATSESLARDLITRLEPAMTSPREHFVTEDYLVF